MKTNLKAVKGYAPTAIKAKHLIHANENPYHVLDILNINLNDEVATLALNRYPDARSEKLIESIAAYSGASKDSIICGNGSDELIRMVLSAFIESGDKVVVMTPSFTEYQTGIAVAGGTLVEVFSDDQFVFNIDDIIQAVNKNKAKMIFLCTPNNPTGQVFSEAEILKVLNETDAIVVSDEAYYEFCGIGADKYIDSYDKLIVMRTLSKALGLASLRVGYILANPKLIDVLSRVKMPYNISTFSQHIASLVLSSAMRLKPMIDTILDERTRVYKALKTMPNLSVYPSGANFILIKSAKQKDILKAFKKRDIVARDFARDILKGCVRISIGTPETNNLVLEAIKEGVSS